MNEADLIIMRTLALRIKVLEEHIQAAMQRIEELEATISEDTPEEMPNEKGSPEK